MLKVFDEIMLLKSQYLKDKNIIITASRGRKIKVKDRVIQFWEVPLSWRDTMSELEEEKEI